MASHVRILAILHIVFSILGILIGIIALVLLGGVGGFIGSTVDSDAGLTGMGVLGFIGGIVFFIMLALSLPGLIAGIGLLSFRPWARILAIIVSALDLLHVPFGTALGIYGLWVLLSNETEVLFRRPDLYTGSPPMAPVP
jgi:hypothetical protein